MTGTADGYLARYSHAAGTRLWERFYSHPAFPGNEYIFSVDAASPGGYILAGSTDAPGLVTGTADALMIRTRPSGVVRWVRLYSPGCFDQFREAKQIPGGGYLAGGRTDAPALADFNGMAIRTFQNGNVTPGGYHNYDGGLNNYDQICNTVDPTTDGGGILGGTDWISAFGSHQMRMVKLMTPIDGVEPGSGSCIAEKELDADNFSLLGSSDAEISNPEEYTIVENYPNPFNPTTTISYSLVEAGKVSLTVYDLAGRQVAEVVNGLREAGTHEVTFDATGLSSGVYIYQLSADGVRTSGKMMLMK